MCSHCSLNIYLRQLSSRYGGITPPRAQELHRENIEKAVSECIEESKLDYEALDAIAVTNRPGLPMSLLIGLRYAKYLARKYSKPIIPVHHMEAHALMARMENKIEFPYLCLLVSGGHTQLVHVKDPVTFNLLGGSIDDAAGEAFDKIARRLKLNLIPELAEMSGGQAIETAAMSAINSDRFSFPIPLIRYRDCRFSFAGLKNNANRNIEKSEKENDIKPDEVIPHYEDFCAGFLKTVTRHLSHRTQRAFEFCIKNEMIPRETRSLVISGGVACNNYIFESLQGVAENYGFKTYRPRKDLCNDNGVMIAWNGVEKALSDKNSMTMDYDSVDITGKASLGTDISQTVEDAQIQCKWFKIKKL